jgi:outer membrane protein OmpA-like peptidoglycan-associated protein
VAGGFRRQQIRAERDPDEAERRSAPADEGVDRVLALQRAAGNQAVASLMRSRRLQRAPTCEPATDSPPPATEVVLFANAVSELTAEQRVQVDNVAYNWPAVGEPAVRIDGYASTPGEDAPNLDLACARAQNVAAELESPVSGDPGIPGGSITAYMHGETDEFGAEEQNRRASIYLEPSAPVPVPTPESPVESPWWPNGPTVARKQKTTPIDQYVAWVREVEAVHGDREDVVHRLRRLYYSTHAARGPKELNPSGNAGPRFDRLIAGGQPAPLTSPPLSLEALNGLFETDAIQTAAGETLDPTHIFAALDLQLQGPSALGGGLQTISGAPLAGVFTWTGDLGSWFIDWLAQKKKDPAADDIALLLSRVNNKVSLDDLLSDMDAQIMVRNEVTTRVEVTPVPPIGIEPEVDIISTLNRPVSDILHSYYGAGAGAGAANPARERFVRFVKAANPRIPYETPDPAKPLEITLAADAEEALFDALYATCEMFLEGDRTVTRIGTPDELEDNEHIVREIARRFRAFLEAGLATGSAPWP